MEEDASNFRKPHIVQQHYNPAFQAKHRNRGKSCSHFMLKFVFIALFLSLLPLFPSDPPEFISHTVFAKSWELIHLLIVGVALSYGLLCRRKTTQIPPKTQIPQPYAPNILHHSTIFDYEEENPSGVSDKNVIPTQSFNLSHYRTEPFVELRRESCKLSDERPLGLPVRSLKTRVVDSDSEEDEECASDSDSDLSGNNSGCSMSRIEKDDNLEENVGVVKQSDTRPTILCKSQSMRADFSMEENGKFQAKQLKSGSFRSPAPEAASSCQKFPGFCSWLPESPNMGRENSWRGNQFYMPVSNFNQVNDYNLAGVSSNLENTSNFFMHSAPVPPSVPFSASGFASGSRTSNHGNEHWVNPNFGNANLSLENSGFFMPSPAICSPMSISANDFASRSSTYNHETENWSKSPILQNGTFGSGENANVFMPSAAFSPSMPASSDDFASSGKASKYAQFNHGSSLKRMDESRSESNNVTLGGENTNNFTASAAFPPSMPASTGDFTLTVQASKSSKFNNGSSPNKGDETRSENRNVALGEENPNIFMPSAAVLPSMPDSADDFASSVQASKSSKFNHGSSLKKMDEISSENNNVALGGENDNIFISSTAFSPLVPTSACDFASSVKASSKTAKFNHVSSVKKKDEMRTGNNYVAVGSFQEETKSHTSHCDAPVSGGKSTKIDNANLGSEKPNYFMKTAEVLPSVPTSVMAVNEFSSSVKASTSAQFNHEILINKDEERSEEDSLGSIGKGNSLYTPHFVDPFSSPTPRVDVSPKKNEQRSIPERWDSDCFVIPSSENNDMGDFLQESLAPSLVDSTKALSSAGSSSRNSCQDQGSPRDKVDESVPWSAPMNNLETENVIEDVLTDDDSYKPSTPSPPLQVQTRRIDNPASSVESSSRALGIRSILDDQGSPPTPERRKALSRASHSRRFSCGSFFDRDLRKSFKDEAKESNRKTKGNQQFARGGKCGWDCLKLDVKPTLNRAALKGKSVRTIRPKEIAQDRQKNDRIELKLEENSERLSVANGGERKEEKKEMVVIQIGISDKRSNSNGRRGEKLQGSSGTSIIVGLNSKQNSNSTAAVLDDAKEEENDSEIDRRADEFIAKFKEQIRLQKVAPRADTSRQPKKSLYLA